MLEIILFLIEKHMEIEGPNRDSKSINWSGFICGLIGTVNDNIHQKCQLPPTPTTANSQRC